MSKRVIVVHGYNGYPTKNWFPWLKTELEERGIEVRVPAMPNPLKPTMDRWVKTLSESIGVLDEETVLVGHSIGGTTILRYLETVDTAAAGVVLVATPVLPLKNEHLVDMNHYFEHAFDFPKIKRMTHKISAIYSTDDPAVSFASGQVVKDNLADIYTEIPNGGHLNEKTGYTTFPLVLDEVINCYDMGDREA